MKDVKVEDFEKGIQYDDNGPGADGEITNVNVTGNTYGLFALGRVPVNVTNSELVYNSRGAQAYFTGRFEGNEISNNSLGLHLLSSTQIINNNIRQNGGHGVRITGRETRIEANTVAENNGYGVYIDSASENVVSSNQLLNNNKEGLYIDSSDGNEVLGNNATLNGREGINIQTSTGNNVSDNTVMHNDESGIRLGIVSDTNLTKNELRGNEYDGARIVSGSNNNVSGNDATNNNQGFFITSSSNQNILLNNNATHNDKNGIYVVSDNNELYGNVLVGNNRSGALVEGNGTIVDGNLVTDNNKDTGAYAGIYTDGGDDIQLTNNSVHTNTLFGIRSVDNDGLVVKGNRITENCGGNAGLRIAGESNNVTVELNNVSNNTGTGIDIVASGPGVEIRDVEANDNGLRGIAINKKGALLDNVTVVGNDNTGVALGPGAVGAEIKNSEVRENGFGASPATTGISVLDATDVTIADTQIRDNDMDIRARTDDITLGNVDLGSATLSGTATETEINGTFSTPADPTDLVSAGAYFNATNTSSDGYFNATLTYADGDVSGLNESALVFWKYDGSWVEADGTVNEAANEVQYNITEFSTFGVFADLFTDSLIPKFDTPPTDTGELNNTLYEDLSGDGDGKSVAQTVTVFGELIRGNDLKGNAPDGTVTDEQASKLDWNRDSPETEVTVADMVTLFGKQIRAG